VAYLWIGSRWLYVPGRSWLFGVFMDIGMIAAVLFAFLAGCFYQGYKNEKPDMWIVFLLFCVAFSAIMLEGSIKTHLYEKIAERGIYARIQAEYTCFPTNQTALAIERFCAKPVLNLSVIG
jgi:hypothetical protein